MPFTSYPTISIQLSNYERVNMGGDSPPAFPTNCIFRNDDRTSAHRAVNGVGRDIQQCAASTLIVPAFLQFYCYEAIKFP